MRQYKRVGSFGIVAAAAVVSSTLWAAAADPKLDSAAPADGEPAATQMSTPASATPAPGAAGIGPSKATKEITWVDYASQGYAIAATEATVDQYKACLAAGKCGAAHHEAGSDGRSSCNFGQTNRGEHPMNCVDYYGAEALCASQGGRLCTKEEWLGACSGPEGRPYPYGTEFDQLQCHSASRENPAEGRPKHTVPVGSVGTCEGGLPGLYDMAGNVMEWVDSCKDTYCKFLGGAYLGNEPLNLFNSCKGPCGGNQKDFKSATVGIRCCKSL